MAHQTSLFPEDEFFSEKQHNFLKDTFAAVTDGSGTITIDQLRSAFGRGKLSPTQQQLDKVWKNIDPDGCGRASYSQFVKVVGEILVANAFPRQNEESGKSVEMDEFLASEAPTVPTTVLDDSQMLPWSIQRRFTQLQSRMVESVEYGNRLATRLEQCEREKDWLRLEVVSLSPFRQNAEEYSEKVKETEKKIGDLERVVEDLTNQNHILQQQIDRDRNFEKGDTQTQLKRLQLENIKLKNDLDSFRMGEAARRAEQRIAKIESENEKIRSRLEESEALLTCVLQVNEYHKSTQQELNNAVENLAGIVAAKQKEIEKYEWEKCERVREIEQLKLGVNFVPLLSPSAGDSSTDFIVQISELKERLQSLLIALRTSERSVDTLTNTNNKLMKQLLSALAADQNFTSNGINGGGGRRVEEIYVANREASEQKSGSQLRIPSKKNYNSDLDLQAPSLFFDPEDRRASAEMQSFGKGKFSVKEADHTTIANWIDSLRKKMKKSSVRYLTAQDSQVLGAELYTSQAFSMLLKRAHAITDDITREAELLKSGENSEDPLALQLSDLLTETVQQTRDLNEIAGAVHKIAIDRMKKMETESEDHGALSWFGVFKSLSTEHDSSGVSENDSLWSLVTLSGILGDYTLSSFMHTEVKEGREGDRMRQFLASVDRRISNRKNDGDTERQRTNASSRGYPRQMHMSMFGIMKTASADS